VTWENTTRSARKAKRRADWHQSRVDDAPTGKARLWAACSWLVSEAIKAGRLDDAFEHVINKVHDIREEEASHDRADHSRYAA
jgi:hypothetical protein